MIFAFTMSAAMFAAVLVACALGAVWDRRRPIPDEDPSVDAWDDQYDVAYWAHR